MHHTVRSESIEDIFSLVGFYLLILYRLPHINTLTSVALENQDPPILTRGARITNSNELVIRFIGTLSTRIRFSVNSWSRFNRWYGIRHGQGNPWSITRFCCHWFFCHFLPGVPWEIRRRLSLGRLLLTTRCPGIVSCLSHSTLFYVSLVLLSSDRFFPLVCGIVGEWKIDNDLREGISHWKSLRGQSDRGCDKKHPTHQNFTSVLRQRKNLHISCLWQGWEIWPKFSWSCLGLFGTSGNGRWYNRTGNICISLSNTFTGQLALKYEWIRRTQPWMVENSIQALCPDE